MKAATGIAGMIVALLLSGTGVWAQSEPAAAKPNTTSVETFYLNVSQASDGAEIVSAVRNILRPDAKVYFVFSQKIIIVESTPDQLALAKKLLKDLDEARKTYRLTYTITELDSGKRIGIQHFTMIVVAGQRTTLKQGSKVPVTTGSFNAGSASTQTQVTYLDIGMNFDATLDEFANGVRLQSKVEQSSVGEERSGLGLQDPVIRQTLLQSTSFLAAGKPLMLGSVDVPGSTRHLDIEVVMETVR